MNRTVKKLFGVLSVAVIAGVMCISADAAKLSPRLSTQLSGLANNASVGVVIVSFNAPNGLTSTHLNIFRGVGINSAVTFQKLGMRSLHQKG